MDSSPLFLILIALLIGFSKGGFGPLGALAVPLLSLTMPVSQAVGTALALFIVADMFALRAYWGRWEMRFIRLTLPGALVGIIVGLALLTTLSDDRLRQILGLFTLGIAAYKLISDAQHQVAYTPRGWHGALAGWGSGFASTVAGAGGPPFTAYLLFQKLPPMTFMGTITLFFAMINLIKLPMFFWTGVIDVIEVVRIAWIIPLIPVGVWLGRWAVNRISPIMFERVILAGLIWAGATLLFS